LTTHLFKRSGLAVAIALLLHGSSAAGAATADEWAQWLERDAGTPPAAAACVAERAFDTLPQEVLDAAPAIGFSGLPGGWRERLSAIYISCAVRTG
jgi:hypothetical protein